MNNNCVEINRLHEKSTAVIKSANDVGATDILQIKLYKRRWFILALFTLLVGVTDSQSIQFTIILNIMKKYFAVSPLAMKFTSTIYSIGFLIFFLPIAYAIQKWNLRPVCVLASLSICIGTWIKYTSIASNGYVRVMIGQSLIGIWQGLMVTVPAALAARWFGPREVGIATSIPCSVMIFGQSVTALITPIIVKYRERDEADETGNEMRMLTLGYAVYSTIVATLIVLFFQSEPKLPPTKSRALQKMSQTEKLEILSTLRQLIKSKNYIIFWNAHGIIVSISIVLLVLLNPLYLRHFKHGEEDVGRISVLYIISGFVGVIFFGKMLDKTKQFKLLLLVIYICTIMTLVLFLIALYFEIKWAIYVSITLIGFFIIAYFSTSFETCAELTYPTPESFSVAIVNFSNQIYTVFMIITTDKIMQLYGDITVQIYIIIFLVVGAILTIATKDKRKRQNAGNTYLNTFQ